MSYRSYYLYQKYQSINGSTPMPVYPMEYSYDGEGTMQPVVKSENDVACGYVPPTEPMYQWVVVQGEYICEGYTKYEKMRRQVSYDGGFSWENLDEYTKGNFLQGNSPDCGYFPPSEPIYRWVTTGGYICSGTTKCQEEKEQVSYDNGSTWSDTGNYRAGTVIEYNSEDCGWQEPQYRTVSGSPYCNGYTKMFDTWNEVSYDGGVTWSGTGVSGSVVIEYDSPECGYPIYRWVDTDDYICIEGDEAQYRTVSGTPYCDGYDLVVDTQEQISPDSGLTWQDYGESGVTIVEENSEACGYVPHSYSDEYMTFDIVSSGTIVWKAYSTATTVASISYSLDSGTTWTPITSSTAGTSFNVSAGDKVMFKGNNAAYATGNSAYNTFSGSTATFNIEGNIMSLISGDSFASATTLESAHTFTGLFRETNTISARNLVLPATTLAKRCYLFMFAGCTSLTKAPELPATTLAEHCYYSMFYNCSSLTKAPTLSATTLVNSCYAYMFNNCSSLNYIKCLATDISASFCTNVWVVNVPSSGTFVKSSGMTSWTIGNGGIPSGWTIEDE